MEVLQDVPKVEDFVPLVEHQSATPASFYNGPPVLHYHSPGCKLAIADHDLRTSQALSTLRDSNANGDVAKAVNGDSSSLDGVLPEQILEGIDTWVTSRYETLASSRTQL